MPVGTPQGGALGPSIWREYTNDLPESCKGVDPGEGEDGEDGENRGNPVEANPITSGELREGKRQGEIGGETGPRPREPEEEAQDEGARKVDAGETQRKPTSNQEEGKKIEKKTGN